MQVTEEEVQKANEKLEFACEFCKRKFKTKRGMHIHRASCIHQYVATEERYVIEDILNVFGKVDARWYLVKFEGYEEPEWQRGHLLEIDAKDAVRHFWTKSGLSPCEDFYPDPENLNRCTVCAKTFKRPQDLKAHRTRTKHYDDAQEKMSPAAERKAKEAKKQELQEKLPNVKWGQIPAENSWQFEYLGAIVQADGKQMPDVRRRVAMARQRHGKMRHVWESSKLHRRLKMRLYIAGVCSVMVYGSETWTLTPAVRRLLNGANSQMVAKITGNSIKAEASVATRSYDLVASIRATRLKWLGQILRMGAGRMVKAAAKLMFEQRKEGDLLMDVPTASSWQQLCDMAADEKGWQKEVQAIKATVHRKKTASKEERGEDKKRRKKEKSAGEKDSDDSDEEEEKDKWGAATKTYKRINQVVRCRDGFKLSVQASKDHYCTPRQDTGPYSHVEVGGPSELEELLLPYADGPSAEPGMRPMIYVNVPAAVVLAVLAKHGGMVTGQIPVMATGEVDEGMAELAAAPESGEDEEMPELEEAPESGEDSSSNMLTEEETEDDYDYMLTQPTSVVQLGAPPPSPPPLPHTEEYDEDGYLWAAAAQVPDDIDTPDTIELDTTIGVQMGATGPSPLTAMIAAIGEIGPPTTLTEAMFSPIHSNEYENDEEIEEVD